MVLANPTSMLAMRTCTRVFANALVTRTCIRIFANVLVMRTCTRVFANALDKRTCARVIANALAMRTLSAAPAGTAATVHSCTCNRVFATVHSCLAYLPLYILAHIFAYLQTRWPCAHVLACLQTRWTSAPCSLLRLGLLPLYILAHIFACLPLYTLVSRICHCTLLHIYLRICKRVGHAHLVRCSGRNCCHHWQSPCPHWQRRGQRKKSSFCCWSCWPKDPLFYGLCLCLPSRL